MIGKTFAQFEIIELLGKGGMGSVYRARDTRLGRDVALKVLPAKFAENPEFNQRFEREVKSLAAVRHPNIVTVHSFAEDDGVTYYTMEFVEGQSLAEQIPANGFPLDRLFQIAIPVTDAVAHAHAHGITHRDLKPANIMLDPDGSPRVLDFGLAKLAETAPSPSAETVPLDDLQTGEGRILGTVAYMSPEQAEGKPADHRSDIFSLGIVLYELATGRRPFAGDTPVSTISAIIKDTPISITTINQRLPRHLWRIDKKCLEKDPDRRYQSVIDLRNDLEELKSEIDSGELVAPPRAIESARTSGARSWLWSVLAIFLVGAGWLGYNLLKQEDSLEEAGPTELGGAINLTRSGKVQSADLTPDGKLLVYTERENNSSSLRVLQLSTNSDVEILPPGPDNLGSIHINSAGDLAYYLNADKRAVYRIPILGGNPQRVFENAYEYAIAPDDQRLAVVRLVEERGELWLGDVSGGQQTKLEDVYIGFGLSLAWSRDGKSIIFNGLRDAGVAERLMYFSLDDGGASPGNDMVWGYVDAISPLRDGSGLLLSGPRNPGPLNIHEPSELWLVPASGSEPVRVTFDPFEYSSLGSDSQGNRLTALQRQYEHTVWVMATENEAQPRQVMYTSRAGRWFMPLTWTSDHRILYPALSGENVHIWEVDAEGAHRRQITSSGSFNVSGSVSPDGRTLAYASNLDGSLKIYLADRDGGVPVRLTDSDEDEFFPDFSPDGQWLVYDVLISRQSRLRKTSVIDGRSVDLGAYNAYAPSFSPDGLAIACLVQDTLTYDYRMSIIDAEDGRLLRTFPNEVTGSGRIRWSPGGDALIYAERHDDADNLWLAPLDGGKRRQLTCLNSENITGFALSTGGDSLAVSTMEETADVVMFEDYRGQIARVLR